MDEFFRSEFQGDGKNTVIASRRKRLNLGALSKIQRIHVPEGFCMTTAGYQKAIAQNETFQALLEQLTNLKRGS